MASRFGGPNALTEFYLPGPVSHAGDSTDQRERLRAWPGLRVAGWLFVLAQHQLIFLGMDRARGGGGPPLLSYNKVSDEVQNLGALFPAGSPFSFATGEGWYFSRGLPTILYTYLVGGSQLLQYDVLARHIREGARAGSAAVREAWRLPGRLGIHLPAALQR
jgi:hypothetical protein